MFFHIKNRLTRKIEKMFRIVRASNFDAHWFNEEFILWPMREKSCLVIVTILNDSPDSIEYWYKVVPNDYKLYTGMVP